MKKHPSGRPIRKSEQKIMSIWRQPPDKPLTPGLNKDKAVSAIGFHHIQPDEDGDEITET